MGENLCILVLILLHGLKIVFLYLTCLYLSLDQGTDAVGGRAVDAPEISAFLISSLLPQLDSAWDFFAPLDD